MQTREEACRHARVPEIVSCAAPRMTEGATTLDVNAWNDVLDLEGRRREAQHEHQHGEEGEPETGAIERDVLIPDTRVPRAEEDEHRHRQHRPDHP